MYGRRSGPALQDLQVSVRHDRLCDDGGAVVANGVGHSGVLQRERPRMAGANNGLRPQAVERVRDDNNNKNTRAKRRFCTSIGGRVSFEEAAAWTDGQPTSLFAFNGTCWEEFERSAFAWACSTTVAVTLAWVLLRFLSHWHLFFLSWVIDPVPGDWYRRRALTLYAVVGPCALTFMNEWQRSQQFALLVSLSWVRGVWVYGETPWTALRSTTAITINNMLGMAAFWTLHERWSWYLVCGTFIVLRYVLVRELDRLCPLASRDAVRVEVLIVALISRAPDPWSLFAAAAWQTLVDMHVPRLYPVRTVWLAVLVSGTLQLDRHTPSCMFVLQALLLSFDSIFGTGVPLHSSTLKNPMQLVQLLCSSACMLLSNA